MALVCDTDPAQVRAVVCARCKNINSCTTTVDQTLISEWTGRPTCHEVIIPRRGKRLSPIEKYFIGDGHRHDYQ
jgi:hypothetical protein